MQEIRASAEDYLETIMILSSRNGAVRSVDIACEMGVTKPSVCVAMRKLREKNCVFMDAEGYITLLPKGREIADRIYERHVVITELFVALGIPAEIAAEDACRIEHVISPESFAVIKARAIDAGLIRCAD